MNDDREREEDPILDLWITNWEEQCVQHVESEPDYEGQLQRERDLVNQKVWITFQNSATAIAQLYKGHFCFALVLFYIYGAFFHFV